ncbi:MAG: DUF4019 domain-containing protein [Nitrosomonas sp.]|nr:MAG: DUF4019 domain-containing protein [Nitrosomonas sp.]
MIKRWTALILLLFLYVGAAIADDREVLKVVESSARIWLALIDEAKYQESWEKASVLFRTKQNEAEWVKAITASRSARGTATARYIATAGAAKSLSGFPDGEYVVLQFYVTFEHKGLALETITLAKIQDSSWWVADYSIK